MPSLFAVVGVFAVSLPVIAVVALWVAAQFSPEAANVLYKFHLIRLFVANLALSTDKKWKKPVDPARVVNKTRSKQVVFIRHGESAWNVVFNKGFGPTFPGRLGNALQREAQLFPTMDSVFVDSPMSALGANQAVELQQYVENLAESDPMYEVLKQGKDTVVASSNLRRALSTATIGLWQRLKRTQEKIHILSALQEITFNIDGVALAKPFTAPLPSDDELKPLVGTNRQDFVADRYYDCAQNRGDKPVRGQGITRLAEFAAWCFSRPESTVIAAGHSLYFRFFFQTFLPYSSAHDAKKNKMANCSVATFTLWEGVDPENKPWYFIDEQSIKFVHGELESAHHGAPKKKD